MNVVALPVEPGKRRRGRPSGVRTKPRAETPIDSRIVLRPFTLVEAVSASDAARWTGVTAKTIRAWCEQHAVGRLIGHRFVVSRLALPMWLEGDRAALERYHAGDRTSQIVLSYYDRMLFPHALRQKQDK